MFPRILFIYDEVDTESVNRIVGELGSKFEDTLKEKERPYRTPVSEASQFVRSAPVIDLVVFSEHVSKEETKVIKMILEELGHTSYMLQIGDGSEVVHESTKDVHKWDRGKFFAQVAPTKAG